MIPLRLSLRNFMSYGELPSLLDFTGWRIACMSGSNGHGKSALFDAMTWALWGRCRAKREDDVVRQGATFAEVEFEFSVGGGTYRVVRKRTVRRSAGQTLLELHVQHDGTWKTATGATIAETQAALGSILRLTYETFINSAFLMQGRADEFTLKAPNERKKVLAEILALGRYDDLTERARVLARERDVQLTRSRERLIELETWIAGEGDIREQERASEHEEIRITAALAQERLHLERLRDEQKDLQRVAVELDALQGRAGDLTAHIAADRQRCADLEGFIARCDLLIADREEITRGYDTLGSVRAALDGASEAELSSGRLQNRILELEKAISAAEHKLRLQAARERSTAAAHEGLAGRAAPLAEQIGALTIAVAGLPLAERELHDLRARRQDGVSTSAALAAENDALGKQRTALRERLRLLKAADALCPVCRAPLGPDQRHTVEESCVAEGTMMKERQDAIATLLENLQGDAARVSKREQELTSEIGRLREAAGSLQGFQQQLQQANEARDQAARALIRAAEIEAHLGTPLVAAAERVEIEKVRAELAQLGYDAQRHADLRRQLDGLIGYQERHERLHRALAERVPRQEQVNDLSNRIARADKERAALEEQITQLRERAGDPHSIEPRLREGEAKVANLEEQGRALQRTLGQLRTALQRIAAARQEHDDLTRDCQSLEKERSIYTDLGHAFGHQGIQAMLIDAVLPEIETVANEILARMTDNSVHVQFSTQRTGSTGNVIETLDIRIADAAGTRSYEMFSGGEAFRVNFAIRIALSRLLAGRAGASLQTLIIDEGFGSQDGAGRERLVEAITSVADDFQKIVVITHIAELRDSFPTQIEVIKGPGGSQVILTE